MKIMCIDDSCLFYGHHFSLKYGEIYEAAGERKNSAGQDCYIIPELPETIDPSTGINNKRPLYKKYRFIPISDIDETELVKEREQVLQEK